VVEGGTSGRQSVGSGETHRLSVRAAGVRASIIPRSVLTARGAGSKTVSMGREAGRRMGNEWRDGKHMQTSGVPRSYTRVRGPSPSWDEAEVAHCSMHMVSALGNGVKVGGTVKPRQATQLWVGHESPEPRQARHSRCGNLRLESRMRENRPYGSEGGEAKSLPYPYQLAMQDLLERAVLPDRAPLDETGPPRSRE